MVNPSERPNQPEETTMIAYHGHCIDGFTAAFIAVKAMYDRGRSVLLIDMDYNATSYKRLVDRVVETKVKDLVVVDFSLDYVILDELHENTDFLKITILDHHKTAFERYAPDMEIGPKSEFYKTEGDTDLNHTIIELHNDECGASLVWKYYNNGNEHHSYDNRVPTLIAYIRDYDLWKFEFGNTTKYINKYLCSRTKTLSEWGKIFIAFDESASRDAMIAEGKELQATHDKMVEYIAEGADEIIIKCRGGVSYKGMAVECSPKYTSDVGQMLAKESGSYGLMYVEDPETGTIYYSLRANRKEYDVTVIAKQFEGGGHAGAAGFELSYPKQVGLINRIVMEDGNQDAINDSFMFNYDISKGRGNK